jgi:hypothetical protein
MHERANRSLILRCPAGKAASICVELEMAGVTTFNPTVMTIVDGEAVYKSVYTGYLFARERHLDLIIQAKSTYALPISFLSTMGVLSTVSQTELNTVADFLLTLERADEEIHTPVVPAAPQIEMPLYDVGSTYTVEGGAFAGQVGVVEKSDAVGMSVRLDGGSLLTVGA